MTLNVAKLKLVLWALLIAIFILGAVFHHEPAPPPQRTAQQLEDAYTDPIDAYVMAKRYISDILKAPSTAEFSSFSDRKSVV